MQWNCRAVNSNAAQLIQNGTMKFCLCSHYTVGRMTCPDSKGITTRRSAAQSARLAE